jgi:hypothetical protein
MAGFRPIGSEKLQGMDKIARIMEIARYKENIPQRVNEDKKSEYSIKLADGNNYEIVREKQGYIIKLKLNESASEYIEPMKGRKYYSSYSQALKRLNLMTKEINTLVENEEEISLFGEQKKFKLKVPKGGGDTGGGAPELPPAPAPAPEGVAPTPAPDMGGDMGIPPAPEGEVPDMGGDMGMPPAPEGEEMPPAPEDEEGGAPEDEEGGAPEDEEGGVSFKMIQKLVGKLGQKLRAFSETEEDGMTSDNVKYVINSVLSALDLTVLDEDDLDEIMSRLEGEEEEEYDDEDLPEDEDNQPEDEEVQPEPPAGPEGEMGEDYDNYGDMFMDRVPMQFAKGFSDKMSDMGGSAEFGGELDEFEDPSWFEDADMFNIHSSEEESIEDDDIPFRKRGPRSRISYGDIDEMFSESKVDKILNSYISEETKFKSSRKYKETKGEIKRLSESVKQERMALKFIEENPEAELFGITNKKNLLFKEGRVTTKVNLEGRVL